MHVPGAFSPDGGAVAFTHTGRNGTDFDLAVVGLDGRAGASWPGRAATARWPTGPRPASSRRLAPPFDHDLWLPDPDGDERST